MSGEHTHPELESRVRAFRSYSGKATDEVVIPAGSWQDVPGCAVDGSPFYGPDERHMVYLRLGLDWQGDPIAGAGVVEVRYVRGDGDATAYDERHYWPGTASVPLQQTHFEVGAQGVGGRWQIKPSGALASVRVTTRYAKLHALQVDWV